MPFFRKAKKDVSTLIARADRLARSGDLPAALESFEALLPRCSPEERASVESEIANLRRRLVEDLLRQADESEDPRQIKSLLEAAREWAAGDPSLEERIPPPPAPPPRTPDPARERRRMRPPPRDPDIREVVVGAAEEEAAYQLLLVNATEREAREYEEAGPEFAAAYGALQRGAFPEAAAILRKLVSEHPDSSFLKFHLASALAASENHRKAAEQFAAFLAEEQGQAFTPTLWAAYIGLSECLEAIGDLENAAATLEKCVRAHPEEHSPKLALAALYRRMNRNEEALALADRVVEDPDARAVAQIRIAAAREWALCVAAVRGGAEARAAIQSYLEQAGAARGEEIHDPEIMIALARACEQEGDTEAARRIYEILTEESETEGDAADS